LRGKHPTWPLQSCHLARVVELTSYSDILAELPVPQSQILAYEHHMPFPNAQMMAEGGYSLEVVQSYHAQLYLRKQLNRIHTLFYNPGASLSDDKDTDEPCSTMEEVLNKIQSRLKDARHMWVPIGYMWKDAERPATNLLAARLRAKYYGSQVIAYRPYLGMILNSDDVPEKMFSTPAPPREQWAQLGYDLDHTVLPDNMDPRIVLNARMAIEALIESTRAFHGLPIDERYIVTNIFGTVHA
jgi:hypothetical protein